MNEKSSIRMELKDLEHKWSRTSHENCCDCGVDFEDNDEVPLRMWKNIDCPPILELALCWACADKRMGKK